MLNNRTAGPPRFCSEYRSTAKEWGATEESELRLYVEWNRGRGTGRRPTKVSWDWDSPANSRWPSPAPMEEQEGFVDCFRVTTSTSSPHAIPTAPPVPSEQSYSFSSPVSRRLMCSQEEAPPRNRTGPKSTAEEWNRGMGPRSTTTKDPRRSTEDVGRSTEDPRRSAEDPRRSAERMGSLQRKKERKRERNKERTG